MENMTKIRLLALVLTLILVLTGVIGCMQSNHLTSSLSANPVPVANVVVHDSSFNPADIVVAAGASVTWTNQDKIPYSIVADDQSFAFILSPEGSFSVTFPDTGVFDYHCTAHPHMQGAIAVVNAIGV
jgi:plastocyanin